MTQLISSRLSHSMAVTQRTHLGTHLGYVSHLPTLAHRCQATAGATRSFTSCKFPSDLPMKRVVRLNHFSTGPNPIEQDPKRFGPRPWIVALGIATAAATLASQSVEEDEVELVAHLGGHFFDTEYTEALECRQKALKIREKELSPDHPDLATSINSVGINLIVLSKHEEALEYIQKAMKIREKVLSPDHLDLAMSYNDMSINLFRLGRFAEALEYAQKALGIREKVLQPNHYYLAQSHLCMSNIFIYAGHLAQALECIQKASTIVEKTSCKDLTLAMLHFHLGANLFILYCAQLGYVNFGGFQKGSDLNDREEGHIAAIGQALDRSKMGPYDGSPNSQNLTGRSIAPQVESLKQHQKALEVIASLKNSALHAPFLGHFVFSLYSQSQSENNPLWESSKQKILTLYVPILGENHQWIKELQKASPNRS